MERFLNAVKAHASALDQQAGQTRFGIISSVDPKTATARVLLQPENVLSGWLPILSAWVGAGWGMICLPTPGQQVVVLVQEGDAEHGLIAGAAFSTGMQPPVAAVGELWLQHVSGSFIKLLNDGSIAGQANRFDLAGDVHVTGTLTVSGDIFDQNAAHGSMATLRADYDVHTHIDSSGHITSRATPQD